MTRQLVAITLGEVFTTCTRPCRPRRSGRLGPLLAASAAALVASACGGGDAASPASTASSTAAVAQYRGSGTFTPPRPAPPLALTDYQGHPFDLAQNRGKVVLVTFLYSHCPDTCPLIASSLRAAQIQLGAEAAGLVLVAVSTDPAGDTPASVARFLSARNLDGGRMEYLLGTPAELKLVQSRWMVSAAPDPASPGAVSHTAVVYAVSAGGLLTTVYASNFKPADVVHDVPLLAAG